MDDRNTQGKLPSSTVASVRCCRTPSFDPLSLLRHPSVRHTCTSIRTERVNGCLPNKGRSATETTHTPGSTFHLAPRAGEYYSKARQSLASGAVLTSNIRALSFILVRWHGGKDGTWRLFRLLSGYKEKNDVARFAQKSKKFKHETCWLPSRSKSDHIDPSDTSEKRLDTTMIGS